MLTWPLRPPAPETQLWGSLGTAQCSPPRRRQHVGCIKERDRLGQTHSRAIGHNECPPCSAVRPIAAGGGRTRVIPQEGALPLSYSVSPPPWFGSAREMKRICPDACYRAGDPPQALATSAEDRPRSTHGALDGWRRRRVSPRLRGPHTQAGYRPTRAECSRSASFDRDDSARQAVLGQRLGNLQLQLEILEDVRCN